MHRSSVAGSSVGIKRKAEKIAKEETPEEKKLKGLKSQRQTVLRKAKAQIDKASKDTHAVEQDVPKLREKTYPEAMLKWFQERIDSAKETTDTMQAEYAVEARKIETEKPSAEELMDATKVLDAAMTKHEEAMKTFRDGVFVNVKKLLG